MVHSAAPIAVGPSRGGEQGVLVKDILAAEQDLKVGSGGHLVCVLGCCVCFGVLCIYSELYILRLCVCVGAVNLKVFCCLSVCLGARSGGCLGAGLRVLCELHVLLRRGTRVAWVVAGLLRGQLGWPGTRPARGLLLADGGVILDVRPPCHHHLACKHLNTAWVSATEAHMRCDTKALMLCLHVGGCRKRAQTQRPSKSKRTGEAPASSSSV